MHLRTSFPARPSKLSRGLRWLVWLVLLVLVMSSVLAAMGQMKSHGLAELQTPHQDVHSDEEDAHDDHPRGGNTAADHAHHGADHTQDKAHALPQAWHCFGAPPPGWENGSGSWVERVGAFRLERPPMV